MKPTHSLMSLSPALFAACSTYTPSLSPAHATAQCEQLFVGQKIRFEAPKVDGPLTVMRYERAP